MKNFYWHKRKHFLKSFGIGKFHFICFIVFVFLDSFVQAFFDVVFGYTTVSFVLLAISKLILLFFLILILIEHDKSKSIEFLAAQKKNVKYKMKAGISCLGCLYCNQFLDTDETNRVFCCFYDSSELLSEDKSNCPPREYLSKKQ